MVKQPTSAIWHFGISLLLFIIFSETDVSGYGMGAPIVACINAYPKHYLPVQTSPSPYAIRTNSTTYKPLDVIEITLMSPINWKFRGFQLRSHRTSGDTEEMLGDFVQAPENVKKQFWYPLNDEQYNCVTHADNDDKDQVVLLWRAPNETQGDLVFSTTFVKNFEQYWIQIESPVIKAHVPKPTPVDYLGKVDYTWQAVSYSAECGQSRGCLLYPRFCSGDDCDHVVSYTFEPSGKYVDFEIMATTSGFVSLGFSHDIKMSKDQTISCLAQGSNVSIQNGYNPFMYNAHQRGVELSNLRAKKTTDKLYCRFRRPVVMTISAIIESNDGKRPKVQPVQFDLSKEWYFFLAWGPVYPGTFVMGHHHVLPIVSTEKIIVASKSIHYGDVIHRDLKIHGVLMLVAWMLFAGMTTILARHFREPMGTMCCHLALWFQLHRVFAMLAAACTAVGIIIIFVYLQKWTLYGTVHAVLGLVVMGLVLLQLIGGICRPDKNSRNRKYFNWFHRCSGKLTHIIAAISMFFAFQIPLFTKRVMMIESVILAVWVVLQILWELLFEFCVCRSKVPEEEKRVNGPPINDKKKASNLGMVLAYFVYDLTMAGLLFASVYFILIS